MSIVALEDEQHSLAAGELGRFLDDETANVLHCAQGVETKARVGETFEWLAEVGLDGKMRVDSLARELARRRIVDPSGDDGAIGRVLVQVASTKALVANAGDAFKQHRMRSLECGTRLILLAIGGERTGMRPPYFLHGTVFGRREVLLTMQRRRLGGRAQRGLRVARHDCDHADHRVDDRLEAEVRPLGDLERFPQPAGSGAAVAGQELDLRRVHLDAALHLGIREACNLKSKIAKECTSRIDLVKFYFAANLIAEGIGEQSAQVA